MITETIVHIASIGVGGPMPAPTNWKYKYATIAATTAFTSTRRMPFSGCFCLPANSGTPHFHKTAVTIWIGMIHSSR